MLTPQIIIPAPVSHKPAAIPCATIVPMPEPTAATPEISVAKGATHTPTVMPTIAIITPQIGTAKIMQSNTNTQVKLPFSFFAGAGAGEVLV